MCNRYVSPEEAEIERFWHIGRRTPFRLVERAVHPRQPGAFIRQASGGPELVVGQWALVPHFAKARKLPYATNNARVEGMATAASYKLPWARSQRCIIPVEVFWEPCWESGRNVWWAFRRVDGDPWGLAGIWNTWIDRETGEVVESYSMLTMNADAHPIMRRMHKPDPALPADRQDKRSVIAIERTDVDQWLTGAIDEARQLIRLPPADRMDARPEA